MFEGVVRRCGVGCGVWAASPARPRRARRGALSAALQGEQPRALRCGVGKRTRDLKVMLAALVLMRAVLGAGLPRGSALHVLSAEITTPRHATVSHHRPRAMWH